MSYWHRSVLGKYSPQDRWIGLDFQKLMLDPLSAELTHIHELAHSALSRSTSFGLATEVIFQLLPKMNHFTGDEKDRIKQQLMSAQYFTQEGLACLMELLRLKSHIGKQQAFVWAKQHFTPEYHQILENFFFVLEVGQYYRDCFTMKIPHLAMHTCIRKAIVEQDLFSSADKFINYLQNSDNNPDYRMKKMLNIIKYQSFLPTKEPEEICQKTQIKSYGTETRQDTADFLNYMHGLTGNNPNFTAMDIRDIKDVNVLEEANNNIIIGNMNLNLQDTATVLWELKDLLHYQTDIESIFVNMMSDDIEYKSLMEQIVGHKFEVALIAFLKSGEKFLFSSDVPTIAHLTTHELVNTTLITKWGLYNPGDLELSLLASSRKPDIVIYNNVDNLSGNFKQYLPKNNTEFIYVGASENHPFQTLVLKDKVDVLHMVNTFNKPATTFIEQNKANLTKGVMTSFVQDSRHFNNALAIWGGMPFEVDWYQTMLDGKTVHYRKS